MPIWYERKAGEPRMTGEVVGDLLELWVLAVSRQEPTHKPEDIAGIIDLMYEVEPVPGKWVLVAASTSQLLRHIDLPMQEDDWRRAAMYGARLQAEGGTSPPIILVGAEDGEARGIALLDGRRRIHAAAIAAAETVEAWVPEQHLGMLSESEDRAAMVGEKIEGAGIVR